MPFELWEVKRFDGGLVSFEQCKSSSTESIETLSRGDNSSVILKVSSEIKFLSEEDHASNLSDLIKPIWITLREKLEIYSDTSFFVTKGCISWKKDNTAVCFIHFRKKELRIDVLRGNIKEDQTKSKGFFAFDDPKDLAKEGSWKWKSGQTGLNYKIRLKNKDDLDYVMFLLEQKYNSLG